jgi:Mlc titration factor MtfA (ptsG expression regulator)
MNWPWLAARRRKRLLAEPFPVEWLAILERNVASYSRLGADEQARLRDLLRALVAEKRWEGCGGLALTDEIKVTIAAQAALLLLGIEPDSFRRVQSIIVYPSGYRAPLHRGAPGLVTERAPRAGEAHYHGPVVLAWDAALRGGRDALGGRNTVLHEFAHQLDFLDGWADGQPWLAGRASPRRWRDVIKAELERRRRAAQAGTPDVLDDYAATNVAEFFAVSTECFFGRPVELLARHPELYELLQSYYRQDPAGCLERASGAAAPSPVAPAGGGAS